MDLRACTFDSRPDLHAQADEVFSAGWPEFAFHDATTDRYLGRVREWFGALNLLLVDEGDRIAAGAWGVPVRWDGTAEGLPNGYDDAVERAVEERGGDTLVIAAAQVREELRGRGLASEVLRAVIAAGEREGLGRVIVPVRPTLKARYPLTPMERFARWTRADGSPLDPWLRTHHRMGGRVLGVAERSMVITGSVTEWETWTGLALPESGTYVVPGALAPLTVDRAANRGELVEPNVWVRHR